MSLISLAIILYVVGALLLFAELFLPTGGVLGVMGLLVILAGLVCCFMVSRWAGVAALVILVALSPFVATWMINFYPKTSIGRQMILQDQTSIVQPPPVHIGQEGVTVSQLRPSGEVDFDDLRIEVLSEYGIIEPGTRVKVVAITNDRPVVKIV